MIRGAMTRYLAIAIVLWASSARADKAAADAAFAEAKRLVAAGKLAEACPKFEVSYNEDPQVGVLLNLADCHERTGKLATARAEFRSASELAHQRNDNREKYATARASKLDNRVAHLVLHARPGVTGVQVTLDDRDVTAMIDSDLPIDTGHHVLVTTSTGNAPSKMSLEIQRDGVHREVTVPAHVEPATPVTTTATEPAPPTTEPVQPVTEVDAHARNVRHAIAGGIAGAGLAVLGVGIAYGFGSQAHWNHRTDNMNCVDAPAPSTDVICNAAGLQSVAEARTDATRSDWLVGIGAGVIAVAAVVWFTAPAPERVVVAPVVGGGTVGGSIALRF
jgi:hypothetical protein